MVGIVFVSHSKLLAEGVKELADQMTQGKVLIEAAGGIEDEQNPIGTDAMRVMSAIENVYRDDDVLVLMDMGSALMSAEMAIQFLPEEMQPRIHLCAAPFVEGGIAASVQAMLGAPIQEVIFEAMSALKGKEKQLGVEGEVSQETAKSTSEVFINFEIVVPNKFGLHARPATKLIELARGLDVDFQISTNNKDWLNAKSFNNLTLLGAKKGDTLYFRIGGSDAELLKSKIETFAQNNFEDNDDAVPSDVKIEKPQNTDKKGIFGIPSSDGVAVGKATFLVKKAIEIPKEETTDVLGEIQRFKAAVQNAKSEIVANKQIAENSLSKSELAIFDAHVLFLEDADLLNKVTELITTVHKNAAAAWFEVTDNMANQYRNSQNPYTKERESDVRDMQELVLKHLGLKVEANYHFNEPVILLAKNLQPSETLKLDTQYVKGFVLQEGNENAHTAILARSLGIPAITGLGEKINEIPANQEILINGKSGEVLIDAEADEWKKTLAAAEEQQALALQQKEFAQKRVQTKEGIEVAVNANISGIADAKLAQENGADGVGLFRTELYFMNQPQEPTEDEQVALYGSICKILSGKSITIRTLDVGGDKPIPYLPIPKEENPFLGLRGIRFLLENKDVFKRQIRAILRVSAEQDVKIMFPMISKMDEWTETKELVEVCKAELAKDGVAFNKNIPCGMMVEVPSVVMCIEDFAKAVDFFSIGTNDLSQYLMAADRGNSSVKQLITPNEKAVLEAIKIVGKTASKFGKPVSVCGELGAKEEIIPFFLQSDIRSLSMNALQIPKIKQKITQL